MLDGSVHKVEEIVNRTKTRVEGLVHTGKEKVLAGTVMAERCNEVLDEIVKNVEQVSFLVA